MVGLKTQGTAVDIVAPSQAIDNSLSKGKKRGRSGRGESQGLIAIITRSEYPTVLR